MKSFSSTIRSLHRDLGYFVIGLTLIYALSGIVLSGRGLGWLEQDFKSQALISQNISIEKFNENFLETVFEGKVSEVFPEDSYEGVKEHLELKLEKNENGFLYFSAWRKLKVKYEPNTGNLDVKFRGYPMVVELLVKAHKASHESAWFYLAIIYSVILSFLAISSFWMVKGKNGFKKRGVYLMLAGFAVVACFLYFG